MSSALIYGHTGAIGKPLLRLLLASPHFARVTAIGRRELPTADLPNPEKLTQHVVDFENLEPSRAVFKGHQYAFCAFGTTRKDAGSAEAFKRIDMEYVLRAARLVADENKVGETSDVHFLYVSSQGSNINSPFLYPQVKGQIEHDLTTYGFRRVSIFNPAMLEVAEPRPSARFGEKVILAVLPAIKYISPTGVSVPVGDVAKAMVVVATGAAEKGTPATPAEAVRFVNNQEIHQLAKESPDAPAPPAAAAPAPPQA
ncbi:hypothetical protein BC828DRAFT_382436 [Blastocladiella britannica]|nr:hypothetical protein BC828DRAFT_382436 [Blastocladiella britannica]